MRKLLIAVLVLFSTTALAQDMKSFKHLDPKQTKTVSFDLPRGTSHITVSSETNGAFFDCTFVRENGATASKTNTNNCEAILSLAEPEKFKIDIKNGTGKAIDIAATLKVSK